MPSENASEVAQTIHGEAGKVAGPDTGEDQAGKINMKMVVADEKDVAGRTRSYYDNGMQQLLEVQSGLSKNFGVSMAALNNLIVATCKQGVVASAKQDENITGINETDHVAGQILNSPWAELAKTIAVAVVAEQNAKRA
ncbi:MAG: hypothetical protein ACYSUP_18815 [Planctomycetota bacterium]|jgi:hypothetical protein